MDKGLLRAFLLVILVTLVLVGYPFLHAAIPYLSQHYRDIRLLPESVYQMAGLTSPALDTLGAAVPSVPPDSLAGASTSNNTSSPIADSNTEPLARFLESLAKTDRKTTDNTRIAHYGDSMIEGDLITMHLREQFQRDFGGEGIGFMPITSITYGFRTTIRHRFSSNWVYQSPIKSGSSVFHYGISGEVFYPTLSDQTYTVSYRPSRDPFLKRFPRTILYYGANGVNDTLVQNQLSFNNTSFTLKGTEIVNQLVLTDSITRTADLSFVFARPMPIYGVSFESRQGVILDNFAMRGSSGMHLSSIKPEVLQQFNAYMNYDLIVLQFGLNVLGDVKDFSWYRDSMIKVIRQYQAAMPSASILLVSTGDRAKRAPDGSMQTDPVVYRLIQAQQDAATQTGAAFFNLFEAMGGANSMVRWVDELKYANKDYAHLNFKGAREAARLMYDYLMQAYQEYQASSTKPQAVTEPQVNTDQF
jgi:hypothetical protein